MNVLRDEGGMLSDEEIDRIWCSSNPTNFEAKSFARAIIAAYQSKLAQQGEQVPKQLYDSACKRADMWQRIAQQGEQPELSTASKSEQLLASHDHALRAEFQRMKAALEQQEQQEQQPMAELIRGEGGSFRVVPNMDALKAIYALPAGTHNLYAAPQQKQLIRSK